MRTVLLIISLISAFHSSGADCIPENIDALGFKEAIEVLEHCKADSPFSYYAKSGDIYYKSGMNTQSIIAYENARLFDTHNSLVNQNLETCYTNTTNAAKELIINDLNSTKYLFFNPKLANTWTVLSLFFWFLFIISILRIFGFKKPLHRAFLAAGGLAFVFSVLAYFSLESAPIGIVTKDDTGCKEFSSETADNTSVLNQGYKVVILESGSDWCKVQLATNKVCWVSTGNLKLVKF